MRKNPACKPTLARLIALASAASMVLVQTQGTSAEVPNRKEYSLVEDIEIPFFTPTNLTAPFLEQFVFGWPGQWHASNTTKKSPEDGDIFSNVGQWTVEEPYVFQGIKGDVGLVAKTAAAHHTISAAIPQPIDNTNKTLVVQYEVKAQNGLVCSKVYMKLLTDSGEGIQSKEFSNKTPYTIMFGPDQCGVTDKVHFIFRHKSPVTGQYEEKHLQNAPLPKVSQLSSLYTLIVRPDQSFEIKINNKVASSGSLLENFLPMVNPSKLINDPQDAKPVDWVDDAQIVDPHAVKPEDWDEDAPTTIADDHAIKPKGWLDNEPLEIRDPKAVKPDDWSDEEDGDWVPATVPNPKCHRENQGCGLWTRPHIPNPAFKGKWSPPMIDHPAYKGEWTPRQIPNPDYFEDLTPSNFERIGAVGFEIWTMQSDLLIDNIYVGHSIEDASALAKETWGGKHIVEKLLEERATLKNPSSPQTSVDADSLENDGELSFQEDLLGFTLQYFKEFVELARMDLAHAMNSRPLVVFVLAGSASVAFGVMLIILGLMSGVPEEEKASKGKEKDDKSKGEDKDGKVTKAEVTLTGASEKQALRKRNAATSKSSQ
ncbi:hypothetical protein EDD11_007900 [Mortierella claussenii]|nr:hypothetical protein EDD11_007900 [Mortierella claussenii]